MKRICIVLAITFSFIFGQVYGQSSKINISGQVLDESGHPLVGATIVLLQAADSVLSSFGMTNSQGEFILRRVTAGTYIIQGTFLGYGKYSELLTVSIDDGDIDVGSIHLKEAQITLDEVTIEGEKTPIFFKKDTIEYNALAFKTQPNAVVEDLLKKLPGIEVEDDGTVKAQGEDVQRILVDGKEFFGNDPQIATKNLPADVVNRVQVFDKKSEMAEFTGVDDGEREKTINLTLKEDKKKGFFGRASAATGPRQNAEGDLDFDRFEGKFNVNKFSKKLQLSVIGTANNINQQGFSVSDYVNFMGGMQGMMRRRGGNRGGGLPISDGLSNGFVDTYSGGINFNYEFSKKTKLNISYFYNNITNKTEQDVFRENFLEAGTFNTNEFSDQTNKSKSHRLNLRLDSDIDSFKQITLRVSGGLQDGSSNSVRDTRTTNAEAVEENTSFADNASEANKLDFNAQFTYKQRFRKKGRSFVAELTAGASDNNLSTDLYSLNNYFPNNPQRAFADTIWQNQLQLDDQLNYGIKLTYTEPIGKRKYLNIEYAHQNFNYESRKDFYDIATFGNRNEVFNPELSNYYLSDYIYDRGGLNVLFNGDKSSLTIGADLQNSQLKGELLTSSETIDNNYLNILPSLHWTYTMAERRRIRFDYETSIREPSIEQLQPLVDNSDPLNIYVGNPDLRPAYNHRGRLHFFSFSQFSFTSIFGLLSATYTQNPIVNTTLVDSLFRQITRPMNVDNDLRLTAYGSIGFPLRFINWRVNFNTRYTFNRGITFINQVENISNRATTSGGITFENQKKEIIDISIGAKYNHNITEYSVSADRNSTWFTQQYFTDITVNFLKTWAVNTDFSYRIFKGDVFAEDQTIALWEASISKYLGKTKRGQLELVAYDMLNQNEGISRSSEINYVEEQRITSLSRFFLIRLTYNLSKFGGQAPGTENIRMHRRRR